MNTVSFALGLNNHMAFSEYHAVKNLLEGLGLEEITSAVQAKNGTLMFIDPFVTREEVDWSDEESFADENAKIPTRGVPVKYGIYKSGYARRFIRGWLGEAGYQLNKQVKTKKDYGYGNGPEWVTGARILQPEDYFGLANLIISNIENYRKTNK